jgi:transcriptional regulator with XRE-family HTH domain
LHAADPVRVERQPGPDQEPALRRGPDGQLPAQQADPIGDAAQPVAVLGGRRDGTAGAEGAGPRGAVRVAAMETKETGDDVGPGVPVDPGTARTSHTGKDGSSIVVVDNRTENRQFLTSRRARITPAQAGLPAYGANRRVPGLHREEVALLAGVSVDYYTRLERSNLGGVSEAVLDALAQALQLDEAERGHLFDLARAANTTARPRRRPAQRRVRPGIQRILDAMDAPADLRNGRRDILAANRLGYALYSELFIDPVRPANVARFVFLSPRAREFFPDWEGTANDLVANLRTEAGRNPYDRGLQDLVGELSTRSQAFRTRWAAHNVRQHQTGRKQLHHPVVGDLELTYEVLALPADPGLSLVVYGAEPGSASQDALHLLASWAATLDQPDQPAKVETPEDA